MGIWSVYIYSYTPHVTVDFTKLPKITLDFLNCKSADEEYDNDHAPVTIDSLGKGLSDCAKIWGYVDDTMGAALRGMLTGLSGSTEMVFSCDTDDIRYFLIRFDKIRASVDFFVVDERDNELECDYFLARIGDIPWVEYTKSQHARKYQTEMQRILAIDPYIQAGELALIMAMRGF